eukprot:SAG31_NODE_29289_length_397_cov_1.721477_1_plen_33_part_10
MGTERAGPKRCTAAQVQGLRCTVAETVAVTVTG